MTPHPLQWGQRRRKECHPGWPLQPTPPEIKKKNKEKKGHPRETAVAVERVLLSMGLGDLGPSVWERGPRSPPQAGL